MCVDLTARPHQQFVEATSWKQ